MHDLSREQGTVFACCRFNSSVANYFYLYVRHVHKEVNEVEDTDEDLATAWMH